MRPNSRADRGFWQSFCDGAINRSGSISFWSYNHSFQKNRPETKYIGSHYILLNEAQSLEGFSSLFSQLHHYSKAMADNPNPPVPWWLLPSPRYSSTRGQGSSSSQLDGQTTPPRDPLLVYKSQDDEPNDVDQTSQPSQEIKTGLSWLRKRFPGTQFRVKVDEDHDKVSLAIRLLSLPRM
ncbi:hypothetical protein ABVK25_000060 [Lepraria finkii]|uniref:Uncharacterized protein n=1 Tax=Lepraria finkii TaxID=1340010 RepID=A0ABR4BLV0_9LECA